MAAGDGRRRRRGRRAGLPRGPRPAGAGHRLQRAPGRAGLDGPPARARCARARGRRPPAGRARGGEQPHQHRRGAPLRGRPRGRRGAARPAVRGPALPSVGQGVDGGGVRRAVGPVDAVARWPGRRARPRVHRARADAGPVGGVDRRPGSGGHRSGRPPARRRRPRAVGGRARGRRPDGADPDVRRGRLAQRRGRRGGRLLRARERGTLRAGGSGPRPRSRRRSRSGRAPPRPAAPARTAHPRGCAARRRSPVPCRAGGPWPP